MSKMKTFAIAMFGAAFLTAMPARAAKPRPTQQACLQQAVTYERDLARGVVVVRVELRNACYPSIDMQGDARLVVDGQLKDLQPLGADDRAILLGEIPLDGTPHQACVRFDGQQVQATRKGTVASAVTYDKCAQVEAL